MKGLEIAKTIGIILLIIGGLNWGLVGLFDFNLVSFLFGEMTALSRIVYVLVGLAGLYVLIWWPISAQSAESARAGHVPH